MPRIRSIKPEFWESERLGRCSVLARLSFVGLISLADDEGRGRGDASFLAGRLHPYSADVEAKALGNALQELECAGVVRFYQVADCSYYELPGWTEHQKIDRPTSSKLPPNPNAKAASTKPRRILVEPSLLDQGSGKGSRMGSGSTDASRGAASSEAQALVEHLETLLAANSVQRLPSREAGIREAEKLLAKDRRPLDEAKELLSWASRDCFWRSNILSIGKFREKYETLRLQRERPNGKANLAKVAPVAGKYSGISEHAS